MPSRRAIRCITASASRRAGIAFGEVNEVTSILAYPHALRRSISSILASVSTKRASFWKPSRVATSWIYRRLLLIRCSCSDDAACAPGVAGRRVDAEVFQHLVGVLAERGRGSVHRARRRAQLRDDAWQLHGRAIGELG